MDHAVPQGMDQGMDRGVWIVCGFGALIHTLYFDSYPYNYIYMYGIIEIHDFDGTTEYVSTVLFLIKCLRSSTLES